MPITGGDSIELANGTHLTRRFVTDDTGTHYSDWRVDGAPVSEAAFDALWPRAGNTETDDG